MATQAVERDEEQQSRAVALSPQRETYAIMKDQARLFSISRLLPDAVRGNSPDEAMANCLIALQMAQAMDELPFMVMQNIHIVKGKAGFAAQFMIARANASGVFKGRINWRIDKSNPANLSVEAYATLAETGEEVAFTADMKMAQAEGWTSNAKYKSMPELMLRYRSATFLVRLYAPDVMLGYRTADELEDIGASLQPAQPTLTADMITDQAKPAEAANEETGEVETVEAEVVEQEPEPEPTEETEPEPEPSPNTNDKAPAESDDAGPAEQFLTRIRGQINAAKNASYLKATEEEWLKNRAAYDDDVAGEIDAALTAKRKALSGGEGGK